ncbi:MAG: hypothetical protein ACYTGL_10800 [Planctomycetota bacterium]|jgi:hypothetical protein
MMSFKQLWTREFPGELRSQQLAGLLLLCLALLITQGCCPGTGTSPGSTIGELCDCSAPPAPPEQESTEEQVDSKFDATCFGGPYPCQESRKKLNNFAIYQRMGLNKLVDVKKLTCDLLRRSIKANHHKSPDRRFQRYNYVIDRSGTIRVGVWTDESSSLTNAFKPGPVDYNKPRAWPMINFDGEDPFEIGADTEKNVRWILTPSGEGAKRVGVRDALSKHYRLSQPAKWRPKFVAETWNSTTVVYAGELIVDTSPEDIETETTKRKTTERVACYYVNNGSGTYRPDSHYLRDVGAYFAEQLEVAPRYLYSYKGDAWEFDTSHTSLIDYGDIKPSKNE